MTVTTTDDLALLSRICTAVNATALRFHGDAGTCVFSSGVVLSVLAAIGIPAVPMRVSAVVYNLDPAAGACALGHDGDGSRRPAAQPGMWWGHLIVVADHVALDPTLDQVNDLHPRLGATPMTFDVTDGWLAGTDALAFPTGTLGSTVRYRAFPGRGGFKHAGDFRPSRRRSVVAEVLAELAASV